jgi:hypothetical protein
VRGAGHVARRGDSKNACIFSVGKAEVKRPLERPKRRWNDNIKMKLSGRRDGGIDWIALAQN